MKRLGKMEQRLDELTKQNEALSRQNCALTDKIASPKRASLGFETAGSDSEKTPAATQGAASSSGETSGSGGMDSQSTGTSSASQTSERVIGGGRSLSVGAGGDPTSVGRAQEVGNQRLGKVPLDAYYDFNNAGFHLDTKDKEFSFGISGMTQLDGMLYTRPTPGIDTSSGFYNPRSRIYFEGHATQPISWEFSFQNFYDTVDLLDAYVNFNYDPRLQVQIGRFKNPFGYEFYRVHIWDLMAPERSVWANNFEANRRFGAMIHGVLCEEAIEYAFGTFDTQRNSLRPFNSRQDFEGAVNFKPFYDSDACCLLRNLQFGGSVDVGNENQSPVPAVLRVNESPGPAAVDSTAASNAASLPFLAFNPTVFERGTRALWETQVAYYYAGLSLMMALEGGHESYANGSAAPVHVPINGWFVQTGYLLTGETIRDRTNIEPLHPFDLREGRRGCGAWEVTARYSQLDLDSRVFTGGLADPNLWSNHARVVDVGLNWYLNQFVKVYFDWEHAMFGKPVESTDGHFREQGNLFWLRTQLFF